MLLQESQVEMAATRLPKSPNLICFAHVSVHYSILAHADLVSFTEGIRNGKLHFLCSPTKIKVYEQIRGGLSYYWSLNHVVHEQWAVWWPLYLLAFWNIELLFLPHIYIYIYKFTSGCLSQTTPSSEWSYPGPATMT